MNMTSWELSVVLQTLLLVFKISVLLPHILFCHNTAVFFTSLLIEIRFSITYLNLARLEIVIVLVESDSTTCKHKCYPFFFLHFFHILILPPLCKGTHYGSLLSYLSYPSSFKSQRGYPGLLELQRVTSLFTGTVVKGKI